MNAIVEDTEQLRLVVDDLRVQLAQDQGRALRARRLAHGIGTDLSIIHGFLDILAEDTRLTTAQRTDIEQAIEATESVTARFKELHALVREINPAPLPETGQIP